MNKLVDQYNNTSQHSIDKKPINADYFALTQKIYINSKVPKFKVNDRVRITKYKKVTLKLFKRNIYYQFCF